MFGRTERSRLLATYVRSCSAALPICSCTKKHYTGRSSSVEAARISSSAPADCAITGRRPNANHTAIRKPPMSKVIIQKYLSEIDKYLCTSGMEDKDEEMSDSLATKQQNDRPQSSGKRMRTADGLPTDLFSTCNSISFRQSPFEGHRIKEGQITCIDKLL